MGKRTIQTALAITLGMAASASAGPVLLASYTQSLGGGRAPWDDARIQFELTLQPTAMSGPRVGIGRGVFWSNGETGQFDFNSGNAPEFDLFEAFATNGDNNKFTIHNLWSDGSGGGSGGAESGLFDRHPPIGHPPDLIGYDLQSVRLIVHQLDFVPWVPEPGLIGLQHTYQVTYEFYGAGVPEPGTFLLAGAVTILIGRSTSRGCRIPTNLGL